jgi:hypothetical protein
MLYNGISPYPDEKILKLSEVFESVVSLSISEKENPSLELIVKVININQGRNEETARNALAEGASIEFVQKITGLDMDTIKSLQAAQ